MKFTFSLSLFTLILLAGCSSISTEHQARDSPTSVTSNNVPTAASDSYAQIPEVVRYDRYLLVNTTPIAVQRDPLAQIVDIHIPVSLKPTMAEALQYVLQQSGYRLCNSTPANDVLYRQSLPGVHYKMGPMRLRTALQVMAGPAWLLEVDDVQRVVCHSLRAGYQLPVI